MDHKKDSSPDSHRSKPLDLNDVEMTGSPKSPRTGRPDVHHHVANEKNKPTKENVEMSHPDTEVEAVPTQPLLEPDRTKQKPPLAGPEIDELDGDVKPSTEPYPGIDDGLLEPELKKPNGHNNNGHHDPHHELGEHDGSEGKEHHSRDGTEDGNRWHEDEADGPLTLYDGYDMSRGLSPIPGSIPDVNTYQQKKNLAQGMMDLALLSANANQLRYVLESSTTHPYYYPSLVFISFSIIFQVAVGVGLIMNSRYNVKDDKDICKADKINNFTVLGVFLVTIVNVFITAFSVASPNTTNTGVQTGINAG